MLTRYIAQATLYGREAYRQAILQRLVPSLRAFNPDLILLSSGFDAANGDVGNCRNYPGLPCQKGMDLSPEDFGWAVAEIMKVADLCCAGKVVSVLEGGYGQYGDAKAGGRNKAPATRLGTRQSGNVTADKFAQVCFVDSELIASDPSHVYHRFCRRRVVAGS